MITPFQTSNFKLSILRSGCTATAEDGQTSIKYQISTIKILVFGVWYLIFERPKGAL